MAKETKKIKKVVAKPVKKDTKKVAKKTAVKAAAKTVKKPVVKEAKAVKEVKVVKEEKKVEKKTAKKPRKPSQKDSGSIDFQIKNFTDKIESLSKHLKIHSHDFDSRRGLLIMVGKRRRLLNYLKKAEPEKYLKVIADLKLKR